MFLQRFSYLLLKCTRTCRVGFEEGSFSAMKTVVNIPVGVYLRIKYGSHAHSSLNYTERVGHIPKGIKINK